MLSTYCQNCGSKNEYRFTKPKFCSSCGQPLSGEVAPQKKTPKKEAPKKSRASESYGDLDQDGTDIYEVPDISRLEYEIDVSSNGNFSLGSLFPNQPISSQQSAPTSKPKRGRPRKSNGAKKKN
jgi:hypothetical protein